MDELVALIVVFGWVGIIVSMAFDPQYEEARGRLSRWEMIKDEDEHLPNP